MEDLNQLLQQRREKLKKITELNINPYPYVFERTHLSSQVINNYEDMKDKTVRVAGRIMSNRRMGKAAFFHIQDMEGRIQIYARKDAIGEKGFEQIAAPAAHRQGKNRER